MMNPTRILLALLLSAVAATTNATAQSAPLVLLVRHAEKESAPADDPPLSAAGTERARALDAALAASGVTAVITTEFKRTRETAAPVAARRGLTGEVVAARGVTPAAHIQAVVAAIRKHTSGVVLVVGHSNTVPAIIAALGGERMRDLCEPDYDNLFVLSGSGTETKLIKSRFGAPDGAELTAPTCAPMRGGLY